MSSDTNNLQIYIKISQSYIGTAQKPLETEYCGTQIEGFIYKFVIHCTVRFYGLGGRGENINSN